MKLLLANVSLPYDFVVLFVFHNIVYHAIQKQNTFLS